MIHMLNLVNLPGLGLLVLLQNQVVVGPALLTMFLTMLSQQFSLLWVGSKMLLLDFELASCFLVLHGWLVSLLTVLLLVC